VLRAIGADVLQGFYFSRPVPFAKLKTDQRAQVA
jgi:EAL domain-containing protein (putative c-di-GMP-specific phosphodiesterase class I)